MKKALLIIDVQNEYFNGKLPITYPENTLPNILACAEAAHKQSIPIVVVQHHSSNPESSTFRKDSETWQLHPSITQLPISKLIHKQTPGSFTNTDLEEWMKTENIKELIITGYMSQMCCDTTARQAAHLGYPVVFIADATGTLAFENEAGSVSAEELHRATIVTQAFAFSKVLDTQNWIQSL